MNKSYRTSHSAQYLRTPIFGFVLLIEIVALMKILSPVKPLTLSQVLLLLYSNFLRNLELDRLSNKARAAARARDV